MHVEDGEDDATKPKMSRTYGNCKKKKKKKKVSLGKGSGMERVMKASKTIEQQYKRV